MCHCKSLLDGLLALAVGHPGHCFGVSLHHCARMYISLIVIGVGPTLVSDRLAPHLPTEGLTHWVRIPWVCVHSSFRFGGQRKRPAPRTAPTGKLFLGRRLCLAALATAVGLYPWLCLPVAETGVPVEQAGHRCFHTNAAMSGIR